MCGALGCTAGYKASFSLPTCLTHTRSQHMETHRSGFWQVLSCTFYFITSKLWRPEKHSIISQGLFSPGDVIILLPYQQNYFNSKSISKKWFHRVISRSYCSGTWSALLIWMWKWLSAGCDYTFCISPTCEENCRHIVKLLCSYYHKWHWVHLAPHTVTNVWLKQKLFHFIATMLTLVSWWDYLRNVKSCLTVYICSYM